MVRTTETDIERTTQANNRTPLILEPAVGGKKLDLLKLYNHITSFGGYDFITDGKGRWRRLADEYNFPNSCTNAGFLLKTVYYRALAAYEIEVFHNLVPPPPSELEFTSAAGGGILCRKKGQVEGSPRKPSKKAMAVMAAAKAISSPLYESSQHMPSNDIVTRPPMQTFLPRVPLSTELNKPQMIGARIKGPSVLQRCYMTLRSGVHSDIPWTLAQLLRISMEAPENILFDDWPEMADALISRMTQALDHQVVSSAGFRHCCEAALILRNLCTVERNMLIVSTKSHIHLDIIALATTKSANVIELRHYALEILDGLAFYYTVMSTSDLFYTSMVDLLTSNDRASLIIAFRCLTVMAMRDSKHILLQNISLNSIQRVQRLLNVHDDKLLSACLDFLYQFSAYAENVNLLMEENHDIVPFAMQLVRLMQFETIASQKKKYPLGAPPPEPEHDEGVDNIPTVQLPPELPDQIIEELVSLSEPQRAIEWVRSCYESAPKEDLTQVSVWQAYQLRFYKYTTSKGIALLQPGDMIKNVSVAYPAAAAMLLEGTEGRKFIIRGLRPRKSPKDLSGRIWKACQWFKAADNEGTCAKVFSDWSEVWRHIVSDHLSESHLPPSVNLDTPMIDGDISKQESLILENKSIDELDVKPGSDCPGPQNTSSILNMVDEDTIEKDLNDMNGNKMEVYVDFDVSEKENIQTEPLLMICKWANCQETFGTNKQKLIAHIGTHLSETPLTEPPRIEEVLAINIPTRLTQIDERGEACGVPVTSALVLRNLLRDRRYGPGLRDALTSELLDAAAYTSGLGGLTFTDLLGIDL